MLEFVANKHSLIKHDTDKFVSQKNLYPECEIKNNLHSDSRLISEWRLYESPNYMLLAKHVIVSIQ
jgi:hypothetical protein